MKPKKLSERVMKQFCYILGLNLSPEIKELIKEIEQLESSALKGEAEK